MLGATAQIPAFPGAEGFGAFAKGGRGGDVHVVTNLESTGPGKFYQGLSDIPAAGRTIVFAVSGEIHLAGGIKTRITGNQLTIAGKPVIDLSRYTSGFTKSPVFTLAGVTGGSAKQGGAGGKLVQFAAANLAGRGGFLFIVTDADGGSWTQQFAICITGSGLPAK